MRRFLIVLMLVCLPLQWSWANVHVTADAAHTASHSHSDAELAAMMVAPVGDVVHSIATEDMHDDEEAAPAGHSHAPGAGHSHESGDNAEHHSHYITALGLASELPSFCGPFDSQRISSAPVARLNAAIFSRIERPKWAAAQSAVSAPTSSL